MTISSDPLSAWLRWLEQQQPGTWATGDEDQKASMQQWQQWMAESLEQLADTLSNTADWQTALAAHVAAATEDAARIASLAASPPLLDPALLERLFGSQSSSHAFGEHSLASALFGHLSAWPALGLAAAREADWRDFQESIPAARRASERYARTLLAMMTSALEHWQAGLMEAAKPPTDPDILREQWLDALETAWQDMLKNPEHALHLLELNTSMERVQTCGARVADGIFRALGMPTREDLIGTQQRLHELRRKSNSGKLSMELAQLRSDMDDLRAELTALRSKTATAGSGDPQ